MYIYLTFSCAKTVQPLRNPSSVTGNTGMFQMCPVVASSGKIVRRDKRRSRYNLKAAAFVIPRSIVSPTLDPFYVAAELRTLGIRPQRVFLRACVSAQLAVSVGGCTFVTLLPAIIKCLCGAAVDVNYRHRAHVWI